MDISDRIITLRTAKGWSVNKLANMAGISQSFLRDIERGEKQPTINTLINICDALGIDISDFFNDTFQESLSNDPLFAKVYALNYKQRAALLTFLNTILEEE